MDATVYAIVETGGKQFRVEEGSKIFVDKLAVPEGNEITLDKVLLVGGAGFKIGNPYVENARVTGQVVQQGRAKKIMVFKRWRRNDSRKLRGHRQNFTAIKITTISA